MDINFFDKKIETADREVLEALQLERLKEIVACGFRTPFYKKKFAKLGMESAEDIKTLADLQKLPFTTKDDLRSNYPAGLLSVDMDEVVRIHSSSGTTGIPTVIYLTQEDLDHWTDYVARSIAAVGGTKKDVFQNMMSYGLFTGGLGTHYGAERLGMTVIPIGGGNTVKQINMMRDFKTTVVHITPSYLLNIHAKLDEVGVKRSELSLKKAIIGAEPHSENTRLRLQELFDIDAYNSYGLSEMNGPGVAFECEYKNGMHVWEDGYIVEIIDPATGEVLPDGQQGEVILTNLTRKAMPLLRYRTRDLARIETGTCPCGRTHRRLSRIKGRTDDMMIINGVNVFPSQIEEILMKTPEVANNYRIVLKNVGIMEKLVVEVEIYSKMFTGDVEQIDSLRKKLAESIKGSIFINPVIELHEPGMLPVYEGKAKRVFDERIKL